ncbi:hypothetical protein K7W42_19300 [Deinococcus sp. HMF7604]|uniref:hypothetical protein n=1 Tax=Deinococcus betulae TaxID=2873312 RepID=UPI001CCB225C|nr:hypothetical protein [Deinococcus betulae]MBZ9752988.1 hypothetical protein [Deinococcus betulae]
MKLEWTQTNERALLLIEEINVMLVEIGFFPFWGETRNTHPEAQVLIDRQLINMNILQETMGEYRQYIEHMMATMSLAPPEAAYPEEFLKGAQIALEGIVTTHANVLAALNKFRGYYGKNENPGSRLN